MSYHARIVFKVIPLYAQVLFILLVHEAFIFISCECHMPFLCVFVTFQSAPCFHMLFTFVNRLCSYYFHMCAGIRFQTLPYHAHITTQKEPSTRSLRVQGCCGAARQWPAGSGCWQVQGCQDKAHHERSQFHGEHPLPMGSSRDR